MGHPHDHGSEGWGQRTKEYPKYKPGERVPKPKTPLSHEQLSWQNKPPRHVVKKRLEGNQNKRMAGE